MQDAKQTRRTRLMERDGRVGSRLERIVRGAGLLAMLVLCAPVARAGDAGDGQAASAETVVRLYPTAVVTGNQIRLHEVAEIEGEAARLVADWPIAAAQRFCLKSFCPSFMAVRKTTSSVAV